MAQAAGFGQRPERRSKAAGLSKPLSKPIHPTRESDEAVATLAARMDAAGTIDAQNAEFARIIALIDVELDYIDSITGQRRAG